MNKEEIKKMYVVDRLSLRVIAEKHNTNHHKIKEVLMEMGIKINKRNSLISLSKEHREKISISRKKLKDAGWIPYNKGLKTIDRQNGKELILKNMISHLRFEVTLDWLMQFDDIEKLKCLNRAITPRDKRFIKDVIWYKQYIEFFYYDEQFNNVYKRWIDNNKEKYLKPSVDHIIPKSKGGNDDISNLQFLSWLENRTKNDMSMTEWNMIKDKISIYFI